MSLNLLLPLKPHSHLCVFILFAGSGICIFSITNMQPFSVLCVEVVSCAKKGDQIDIMSQKIDFLPLLL